MFAPTIPYNDVTPVLWEDSTGRGFVINGGPTWASAPTNKTGNRLTVITGFYTLPMRFRIVGGRSRAPPLRFLRYWDVPGREEGRRYDGPNSAFRSIPERRNRGERR